MNNKFIESMFDDIHNIEVVGPREWVVETRRWTGMRDCYKNNVIQVNKTWVKVAKSGRVSLGPISDDLI